MQQQINNINNSDNNEIFSYKYYTKKKKKRIAILHKESERLKLRRIKEIITGNRQNSNLGHYSRETPSNPNIKLFFGEKLKRKLVKLKGQDGSWSGSWSWSGTSSVQR